MMMNKITDILSRFIRNNKYMLFIAVLFLLAGTTDVFADGAASATSCDDEPEEKRYLCYCAFDVIKKKYAESGCWSCGVIGTLMKSMTDVATTLFAATKELSGYILALGSAIWFALYFLKSVSAFATQDPAKIIDGMLSFGFKVALVSALIFTGGIDGIIEYIINPLLSIGFDIGEAFSNQSGLRNLKWL